MHVSLASTDVPKDTWLLFLPFFPVKTKALVVLGIGVFVLLLSALSLLMSGYLFIFHLFLSMCPDPHSSLCPLHSNMAQDKVCWPLLETSTSDKSQEETPLEGQQGSFCSEACRGHERA